MRRNGLGMAQVEDHGASDDRDAVLLTKLLPPPRRPGLIARGSLVAALEAAWNVRLGLVTAPAGWGKSSLLSEWIAHQHNADATAFVALDDADADPAVFWAHVAAALGRARSGGPLPPEMRAGAEVGGLRALVNWLTTDGRPIALVLDDYQAVANGPVDDQLAWLLEHAPPTLHVVIASRVVPPLPVARLRAGGDLIELHARDLGFTAAEASILLNGPMALSLPDEIVHRFWERTDGWPAALYLAGLSARAGGAEGVLATEPAGNPYLVDYLTTEVMGALAPELRHFLLRTSVLERVSAPLCDAVLGRDDSRRAIDELQRRDLFLIPLDARGEWFRYHHLIRDVLRAELAATDPEGGRLAHARAAAWITTHDRPERAIAHLLAAEMWEEAASLIATEWLPAVNRGSLRPVRSWLERLPEEAIENDPRLALAMAWTHLSLGLLDDVERWLVAAEASDGPTRLPGATSIASSAAIARALLLGARGSVGRAAEAAERALALEAEDGPGRARAAVVLGVQRHWAGADPTTALVEAIRVGRACAQHLAVAEAEGHLALWELERGRAEDADGLARAALAGACDGCLDDAPQLAAAHMVIGRILLPRQPDRAADELERAVELAGSGPGPVPHAAALVALADAHLARGEHERSQRDRAEARAVLRACEDPGVLAERLLAPESREDGTRPPQANIDLTEREGQILRLLASLLTLREIGDRLYLSRNTVKTHVRAIYRKLDVADRASAVRAAREQGLLGQHRRAQEVVERGGER